MVYSFQGLGFEKRISDEASIKGSQSRREDSQKKKN
jgi:hypothetical protein